MLARSTTSQDMVGRRLRAVGKWPSIPKRCHLMAAETSCLSSVYGCLERHCSLMAGSWVKPFVKTHPRDGWPSSDHGSFRGRRMPPGLSVSEDDCSADQKTSAVAGHTVKPHKA